MVSDFCMDVIGIIGKAEFVAKRCVQCGEVADCVILLNRQLRQEPIRCVQCGEVVDCAILLNRQLRQEPMTVQRAGKMVPNNCVMEGR